MARPIGPGRAATRSHSIDAAVVCVRRFLNDFGLQRSKKGEQLIDCRGSAGASCAFGTRPVGPGHQAARSSLVPSVAPDEPRANAAPFQGAEPMWAVYSGGRALRACHRLMSGAPPERRGRSARGRRDAGGPSERRLGKPRYLRELKVRATSAPEARANIAWGGARLSSRAQPQGPVPLLRAFEGVRGLIT